MAEHYETIWTRNTKAFEVNLSWTYDPDGDVSWDETGEVLEKLQSGEWTNHLFRVQVIAKDTGDVIGEDYLGGSIYADASEFIDHRLVGRSNRELAAKGDTARCGSYFTDMVHGAVEEARKAYAKPRTFLRQP